MTKESQQIVLVTGATSGIGRDAALTLARRGHRVFATGRRPDALAELEREGVDGLETLRLDVNNGASIEAARAEVDRRTEGRGVDVLVNNAGYGHAAPLELMDTDELRAQFDTNVFGLMAVTRAFLPAMKDRGAGRVVNVSSIGGRLTFPLMGAYNATKFAVESLSDALRMELAHFGVQVALVEPGPIETNFSERSRGIVERYDGRAGDYAAALARADEVKERSDRMSAPVEVVTRAIVHAVEARRPRTRYVVPRSGRLLLAAMALLPTRWRDALLRRLVGITPDNLGRRARTDATGQKLAA